MPSWAEWLAEFSSLTHFIDGIRSMLAKGLDRSMPGNQP